MSALVGHPNSLHAATVNNAEMTRQVGVAAAIAAGGSAFTIRAAIIAVEAAFYRAVIASCVAQNLQSSLYRQALHDVAGVWT